MEPQEKCKKVSFLESGPFDARNSEDALPSSTEIQGWITSYLSKLLNIEADEVDVDIPFDQYGLDSSAAVGMTGDLEDWLGQSFDATLLYDYPTIESLAQHIAGGLKTKD
jgi:acyl carrier protein